MGDPTLHRWVVPGCRAIVQYDLDPGWSHERLWLWPVLNRERCICAVAVYTPDGEQYVEAIGDYSFYGRVEVTPEEVQYPPEVQGSVVRFSEEIEDADMMRLIRSGRLMAETAQATVGVPGELVDTTRCRNFRQGVMELRRASLLDGLRRRVNGPGRAMLPLADGSGGAARPKWKPPKRLRGKQRDRAEPMAALVDAGAAPVQDAVVEDATGRLGRPAGESPAGQDVELKVPDGSIWVVSDPGCGKPIGTEIEPGPSFRRLGPRGVCEYRGKVLPLELVKIEDVVAYPARRLRDFKDALESGPAEAAEGAGPGCGDLRARLGRADDRTAAADTGGEPALDLDDPRTLWVDVDAHGLQYKDFREWVFESYQCQFASGCELDGPPIALDFLKYMLRNGGSARGWWAQFRRDKKIEDTDRVSFEALPLVELVQVSGEFDQLNAGGCAFLEVACKRLMAIAEAHEVPSKPDWTLAKYFVGMSELANPVPSSMRTYVQRQIRDANERSTAQERARSLRGGDVGKGGGGGFGAAGLQDGESPAAAAPKWRPKGGGGKGRRAGRTRTPAAPADG